MPAEIFADGLKLVVLKLSALIRMVLRVGCAIRERVILVCFLWVGIRADLYKKE
jgi:hypothetical protein